MRFYEGLAAAAMLIAMAHSAPAGALVYVGNQVAGPTGSGRITVETDGTLGVLAAANILSWSISSTIEGVDYQSASGGPASDTTVIGGGLSGTASDLIFDFGSDGFFGIADFADGETGFCVDGAAAAVTCNFDPPSLSFFTTVNLASFTFIVAQERRTGIQVLASVPEPASMALLAVGLTFVAGVARRR